MAEYIRREAVIERLTGLFQLQAETAKAIVDAIPAADVVEVVRCKDCKHWFDNGTGYCSCDRDALLRERNFFCASGERRGDDDV